MSRRVLFHVGLPKAGTTFVQTVLWHHRRTLRQRGLLYPGSKRLDHYHAAQDVRRPRSGRHTGAWRRLLDEAAAWPGDVLISHEFFSMATADQARAAVAALHPADVDVVVTARDYVRQFPAMWQEAVKMGSPLTLDDFMDRALARELSGAWSWRSQDLPRVLRRWSVAVPEDRVHLVTVPPPGAARDLLWQRWCQAVSLDLGDLDLDTAFGNESLGVAQLAFLQRLQPFLDPVLADKGIRHRWVRQYLGHEVLGRQPSRRIALRADHAEQLGREATEAVRRIARRGYHVVGDLGDLHPTPVPAGAGRPAEVSDPDLLEVACRAVDVMVRDVRTLTAERDRLRKVAASARRDPPRQPGSGVRQ